MMKKEKVMSMMTKRSMETKKKEDTATVKLESAVEETQMMMMRMKRMPSRKGRMWLLPMRGGMLTGT